MTLPPKLASVEEDTERLGFTMASERDTGQLLRVLAATKPGGRLLELGTGTGLSACWLLDGMDADSQLLTVDNDEEVLEVARKHLGDDPRLAINCADGGDFLGSLSGERFDLIFADAWPGKFTHLGNALELMAVGGIYIIDDLLPQPSWPDGHAEKVPRLLTDLGSRDDLDLVELNWATGIVIATKVDTR